jgi:hypothetical protein
MLSCLLQALCAPSRASLGAGEQLQELVSALREGRSERSRLQAAATLGRLGDREAVPALVQALIEDKSEPVRAACADALGQLADPDARGALKAALSDPSPAVRGRAEAALARLAAPQKLAAPAPGPVSGAAPPPDKRVALVLGRMGSKARGTTPDLPRRLREAITRELRDHPNIQLMEEKEGGRSLPATFSVESSVVEMSRRTTPGGQLEVTCEVSMVIALMPSRSIVGMTSGGATIQAPRRLSRPDKAAAQALEQDALNHAVRGANQNLVDFLRKQN